ncbi:MAG TPA: DUF4397 domain-containing protein [Puia sp.]|nr:DUF4397 domain-containing protein [Puia sp.]
MSKRGMFSQFVVLIIMIGGLTGCIKSGSSFNNSTSGVTFISILNLSSSSADIYLNGTKASQNAAPAGFYDPKYEQIKPGAYDIQFKAGGVDSVLADVPSSLYDSLDFNTIILYNAVSGGPVNAMRIADDFSTLSVSTASYRFFNMSPDVPSVDVFFNGNPAQTHRTTADNASNTGYNSFQSVSPGTYTVDVKKAGTDSVIVSLNGVTLAAGTATTIFLKGRAGNTTNPISLNALVANY